jgi:hypothetical protein
MAAKPNPEFGKRRPAPPQPAARVKHAPPKRSNHVALLLMGSFAIGGGAYALMPRENCTTARTGMASDLQPGAECPPRGSTSGGHGSSGGSASRSSFYGVDSSHSPAGTSSDAGAGGVTRGGFGSFAHAFAAHFSGGG